MNNLLVLNNTSLVAMERSEQINYYGGTGEETSFLVALSVASPIIGAYCGLLTIAYYGGYTAHLVYDAVK